VLETLIEFANLDLNLVIKMALLGPVNDIVVS